MYTVVDERVPGLKLRRANAELGFDSVALVSGLDFIELIAVLREAWLGWGLA